jgi:spermidine synthase
MRRFSVLLGSTAPAAALALTAFFGGLAVGSFLLGRLSHRLKRPLLAFACLEAATAISALSVEPLLRAMEPLYQSLYDTSAERAVVQLALRAAFAIVAVLVPATCMGGTLPVLSQVAGSTASLGVRAGGLYAANTLGAAIGALAVPAVLLPFFGANGALAAIMTMNVLIAIGAVLLARRPQPSARRRPLTRVVKREEAQATRVGTLQLAFFSGAITLALEALATRAFALVHENSVYSFATVVAVFLAGLGIGAAATRAMLRRGTRPRSIVATGWALAAVWIVWFPAIFVRTTGLDYIGGAGLLTHELRLGVFVVAGLLAPGALLGLALPALIEAHGQADGSGRAVGAILAANTLGAIVGPLVAAFALLPALGIWNAIAVLGLVSMVAAAAAEARARSVRRTLTVSAALIATALLVSPPGGLPRIKLDSSDQLLEMREGAFGTVAVVSHAGHRRIKLNNFYVLGGTASAGDERLQGHIPLLLHPRPQRVAYLGVGTAISLSAIRFHPVAEVAAMELVPEVVSAARDWFREANLDTLNDPRVRVRAEDARGYLGATRERFDLVIGDLVVPWRRGESALYTRDSFAAARRVLAPGGLYCQWIPLYQLSEAEFDSIAASFLDIFPRTTLWRGDFNAGEGVVALIGHIDPFDPSVADQRTRTLAANPDRSNPYLSHPAGLWMYFVGPLDSTEPRLRSAPRNLDASPWVELASPRFHLRIGHGGANAFVARPLKARLDEIRVRPVDGTAAASLDAEHLAWRDRGADIWAASLLSFEGDNAAADRLGLATLARLPSEIQTAVLGGKRPVP